MKDRPNPENADDPDEIEQVAYSEKSDLDCIIEDFFEEARHRDTTPKMQIYKYENDKTGSAREFCGYFTGEEIPDKHHIGLLYGGGRYFIHLKQPKGKAKLEEKNTCLVMKISRVYDELKAKADEEKRQEEAQKRGYQTPMLLPPAQPPGTPPEAFVMMKEMMAMLLPLLKTTNAPIAQVAPAPDLLQQYAVMQKVLQKNLFDTAETYRNFSRRFQIDDDRDAGNDDTDTTDQEPSLVEKIIKMIEPFFGLIAQKGSAAQLAAQGVRSVPQFAELLNDPALCRMIVQYFDKTKGVEASNQALQNLGIDRRQIFAAANPGGAPGGHTGSPPSPAAARTPGSTPGTPSPEKTNKRARSALKPV